MSESDGPAPAAPDNTYATVTPPPPAPPVVLWATGPDAPPVSTPELHARTIPELQRMANALGVHEYSGLRKQDLDPQARAQLLAPGAELRASGVLEIIEEGYGFLRSQDWS